MHNSAGRQNPHAVPPPPQTHWPGWQAWQPHFPRIRGVCGPSSMKESGSDWASPPRALETGAVPMAPMLFDIIIANGHPCHSITPSPELGNPAPFAQPTYICKYAWRAGLMADGPVLAPVRLAPACFISQRVGFISSGPPRWLSTPIRPLPGPIVGAGRESIACLQFPPRTGRLKSTAKSKTGLDQTPRRLHGEGPRFLAWLLCLDEKRQRGRGAARQVAASTVANCMAPGGRRSQAWMRLGCERLLLPAPSHAVQPAGGAVSCVPASSSSWTCATRGGASHARVRNPEIWQWLLAHHLQRPPGEAAVPT